MKVKHVKPIRARIARCKEEEDKLWRRLDRVEGASILSACRLAHVLDVNQLLHNELDVDARQIDGILNYFYRLCQ